MLEVGVSGQNGHSEGGLTAFEERSHFALWAVCSSPLTLSFDLGDAKIMNRVWGVISNPEVLAVNQQYFGHPGTLVDQDKDSAGGSWQVWAKPQAGGATAVLLLNTRSSPQDLTLALGNHVNTADLWARKALGVRRGTLSFPAVASHDSLFLLLTPSSSAGPLSEPL
jgi:alpha-galactosidase